MDGIDLNEIRNGIRNLIEGVLHTEEDLEQVRVFLKETMKSKEVWIELISNVMGQVPKHVAENVTDEKFEEFKKIVFEELKERKCYSTD